MDTRGEEEEDDDEQVKREKVEAQESRLLSRRKSLLLCKEMMMFVTCSVAYFDFEWTFVYFLLRSVSGKGLLVLVTINNYVGVATVVE